MPAPGSQATGGAAAAVPPAPADPREPGFATRGRLRRRLRYLRRVRELGYRDLGGLVFDQHRFQRANETLVQTKVGALAQIDGEVRALEHALQDRRAVTELREAGIAACPRCGAIHGSESRFCPACGLALTGPTEVAAVHVPTPVGSTTTASAPSTPPRPVPVPVPSGPVPPAPRQQSAPFFGSVPITPPTGAPGAPPAPAPGTPSAPPSAPVPGQGTPVPGASPASPASGIPTSAPADATIHARVGVNEQPTTVLRASDQAAGPVGPVTGGDPLAPPTPADAPPLSSGDPLAPRPSADDTDSPGQ